MTYQPFPAFSDWKVSGVDLTAVDRHAEQLRAARASAAPERLAEALEVALRTAAVDTNAIE
ncbi:MAG: hypothetical protein LBH76_03125, partial [Propionibacteriaceae bacterium]|nr:hypothetical protein [Propionibacteriaceae bacterium]